MSKIKNALSKLACPLTSALIQVFIILVIFMQFFEIRDQYHISINNAKIKRKIESKINQCGKDYWISWLVLDGNSSKKKYYFEEVMGCNEYSTNNNDCSFSVKNTKLNPFYNEIYHRLDSNTYELLTTMDTGMVAYFGDTTKIEPYKSMIDALEASNLEIKSLGVSVTRNIAQNLVYVFTISKTGESAGKCDKRKVVGILEELSIYAKENL